MNITIIDDMLDTVRTLPSFGKVADHRVTIWNDRINVVNPAVLQL